MAWWLLVGVGRVKLHERGQAGGAGPSVGAVDSSTHFQNPATNASQRARGVADVTLTCSVLMLMPSPWMTPTPRSTLKPLAFTSAPNTFSPARSACSKRLGMCVCWEGQRHHRGQQQPRHALGPQVYTSLRSQRNPGLPQRNASVTRVPQRVTRSPTMSTTSTGSPLSGRSTM